MKTINRMQKVRLVFLCACSEAARADKQQGTKNTVNRFHSVIVGLCLQFPKVAAKLTILSHFNQRIALRNNIVHFKTEKYRFSTDIRSETVIFAQIHSLKYARRNRIYQCIRSACT